MINRITACIEAKKNEIQGRLDAGIITPERVEVARKALDMDIEEHAMFQTYKSLAVTSGDLNADEGQTIYVLLGETVGTFNAQSVAVKAILAGLFKELLAARIASMKPKAKTARKSRR